MREPVQKSGDSYPLSCQAPAAHHIHHPFVYQREPFSAACPGLAGPPCHRQLPLHQARTRSSVNTFFKYVSEANTGPPSLGQAVFRIIQLLEADGGRGIISINYSSRPVYMLFWCKGNRRHTAGRVSFYLNLSLAAGFNTSAGKRPIMQRGKRRPRERVQFSCRSCCKSGQDFLSVLQSL